VLAVRARDDLAVEIDDREERQAALARDPGQRRFEALRMRHGSVPDRLVDRGLRHQQLDRVALAVPVAGEARRAAGHLLRREAVQIRRHRVARGDRADRRRDHDRADERTDEFRAQTEFHTGVSWGWRLSEMV
jgi:hypothetical protein